MDSVVIVGDSLSLPREGMPYRKTYPYLLAQKCNVVNLSTYRNYTKKVNVTDVLNYDADYTVIHLGIVDCAPRLFSLSMDFILSHVIPKNLSMAWIAFKSRHRRFFTKYFHKVYTSLSDYAERMMVFNKYFKNPIVIGIMPTSQRNKKRSYGFDENIRKYNAILKRYNYIPVPPLYIEDGIHLTEEGHRYVADMITKRMKLCGLQ